LAVNHYDCLKVSPDAPVEVIRAAYRALAGKLHPDRQGGTGGRDDDMHDQMAALNNAYEVLVDPTARADYDAALIAQATAIDTEPASEAADQSGVFSETRVDVDWLTLKTLGPVPNWPPSRKVLVMGGAAAFALIVATIWVTWQLMSRHQMEQALSDQYAAHPISPQVDPESAGAAMPSTEPGRMPVPAPRPAPSSDPDADVPRSRGQPTVAELARMSDEQLLEVLPTLGEPDVPKPLPGRTPGMGSVGGLGGGKAQQHHPLDGNPLNLRTEKNLVDPLAEEPALPAKPITRP
jgi:curved DNA-binding protein CbpA